MQQFTGLQYLKIDIANNFGLDKKLWNERIDWFDAHESQLENMVPQAEVPALFYAGVKAYRDAQAGIPSGYPISLDASSSGIQLLACLTGDRKAAAICNVIDSGKREDAYTAIYEAMLEIIGEDAQVTRNQTKEAIMHSVYGSEASPKRVFGEGILLDVFKHTMSEMCPVVWELNKVFLDIWDSTVTSHDWVLPDNFHVHVKVMNQRKETVHFLNAPYEVFTKVNEPVKKGRSLGANTTHSLDAMIVREMVRRCDYSIETIRNVRRMLFTHWNPPMEVEENSASLLVQQLWKNYEESGYLSARILDYLNYDNFGLVDRSVILELIESLPAKPFKILTIHDAFRCLPSYGNDLRKQYILQLSLIAKSEMLSYLMSQIMNRPINVGKADPDLWKEILESEYPLS